MMLDLNISRDYASHILVIDSNHFSTAHLCKLTPSFIRKCDTCSTKALFPHRYSSVHFLNVLPFMQTTMNLFKTFLGPKSSSRIFMHSTYETFYKCVPREILPIEYGGTYPFSITEIRDDGYRIMVEERNWFLDQGRISPNWKKIKKTKFSTIFLALKELFEKSKLTDNNTRFLKLLKKYSNYKNV